jgi:outer membrane beta-barrel protein
MPGELDTTMRSLSWILALSLCSTVAYAQDEPTEEPTEEPTAEETPAEEAPKPVETIKTPQVEDSIVVNQRKPFLQKGRFELSPQAGVAINDPFLLHYSVGGGANYYLSEVLSVGVQAQKYIETSTGLDFDVIQLNALPDLNRLEFYGGVHFTYSPVYGKFSLFNQRVVGFNSYISLGAGVTGNSILQPFSFAKTLTAEELPVFCATAAGENFAQGDFCQDPSTFKNLQIALSPSIGLGFRFYVSDAVSITMDFKDYIFQETTLSGQNILTQNVMFTVGTSFFFPTTFEYKAAR